ncbi:MAG: tRNA lysidine(34) synthetase TilS [Oscillospiraceae bacterium]
MMEEKVLQFIRQNRLFADNSNVITALSGGADSMALFHFLYKNRQGLGISLQAAHFNHGLRGNEADGDAAFVESTCQSYGVELFTKKVDMAALAKPRGLGTEEWARLLRYRFFEELAGRQQAVVATAHTLSDNAETVLFHAIRGSGPRGLSGIPVKRSFLVRPFLCVSRSEIEEYCQRHKLEYVTDSTNQSTVYSRNQIRLQALPALEKAHPGAQSALGRMAADMAQLDQYLARQAQQVVRQAKTETGFLASQLLQAAQPVRLYALSFIAARPVSRNKLALMERVLKGELAVLQLGENTLFTRRGEEVLLTMPVRPMLPPAGEEPPVVLLQEGETSLFGGYRLLVKIQKKEEIAGFLYKTAQKSFTFVADYDKITKNSVFRTRRPGDCFSPPGRGLTKTLKKWMNEQKTPVEQRWKWPLLCAGGTVLWVWGTGFCEGVGVTEKTTRILSIEPL